MVKMAHVYVTEGNIENAYILYFKFMTLFIEQIPKHPEFKSVSSEMKLQNTSKLKEIMPIAERLKKQLLERYKKEYAQFLLDQEEREQKLAKEKVSEIAFIEMNLINKNYYSFQELRDAKARMNRSLVSDGTTIIGAATFMPSAPDLDELELDQVIYPDDFPTNPQKTMDARGLILPDQPNKPAFDRNLKPTTLQEGVFRTVNIPDDTMLKFLQLAEPNTLKNIETCGILAGQLKQNKLNITHVILPKQSGTADSCTTMNEEELFEIQDQQNLITLGWIHTHPSQTAFLSSVDLHTHCSYQIMLPEAIAIVCSPKYETTGFFCLTPSYGLDFISSCRLNGFHPHPNDPPLFMEAEHIDLSGVNKIKVVDLRK